MSSVASCAKGRCFSFSVCGIKCMDYSQERWWWTRSVQLLENAVGHGQALGWELSCQQLELLPVLSYFAAACGLTAWYVACAGGNWSASLKAQKSLWLEGSRQNRLFVFSVVGYSPEGSERWSQEIIGQERAAWGCSIWAGCACSAVII